MEEKVKNLCAPIPAGLHARVREEQEASGKTLGQYMAWLIQTFYENQVKEENIMIMDKRTVAFQVPGELFEKFKAYLQERGIRQNAFFLDCIHRALAEAQEERWMRRPTPTQETGRTSRRRPIPRRTTLSPKENPTETRAWKKAVQKNELQEGIRPDWPDPFLLWRCFLVHLSR